MKNGMIYDGGKLFPCDAIQSRISDQATVTAVTNLLAEDPDIVNAPTEEQEKKETTAAEGNDMTFADPFDSAKEMDPNEEKEAAKEMDPNEEKEAEKEAEENQTDKKEKLACKLNS